MTKKLAFLLIAGMIALAAFTSGCTDTNSSTTDNSSIADNEVAEVAANPGEQNVSADDTVSVEPVNSVYTENNSTSSVKAVKGDTILVTLEENPTTGYSWNLSASSGLLLVDDKYIQDPAGEGMVGVGGVHNWTFEVVEDGVHNISAIYKRPWERSTTGEEDTFELTVDVTPLEDMIQTKGTVVYVDLEGGFYGIAGDDNTNYDPLNLGTEFMQDGLEVEFTAYPADDVASFHMWGRIIEIRSIQAAA